MQYLMYISFMYIESLAHIESDKHESEKWNDNSIELLWCVVENEINANVRIAIKCIRISCTRENEMNQNQKGKKYVDICSWDAYTYTRTHWANERLMFYEAVRHNPFYESRMKRNSRYGVCVCECVWIKYCNEEENEKKKKKKKTKKKCSIDRELKKSMERLLHERTKKHTGPKNFIVVESLSLYGAFAYGVYLFCLLVHLLCGFDIRTHLLPLLLTIR